MGKIIDSSLSNVWRSHTEMKALEIHKIWHNVFSLLKFESILRLVGKKAKPKLLVSSPIFHKLKMMDWNIKRNIISINFLIVISTSGNVILQDNSHVYTRDATNRGKALANLDTYFKAKILLFE